MTVRITTREDLKINFYEVEKIIEKENSIFLQNTVNPFIIGIAGTTGTPMSTYGIDIYRAYIKKIEITNLI